MVVASALVRAVVRLETAPGRSTLPAASNAERGKAERNRTAVTTALPLLLAAAEAQVVFYLLDILKPILLLLLLLELVALEEMAEL